MKSGGQHRARSVDARKTPRLTLASFHTRSSTTALRPAVEGLAIGDIANPLVRASQLVLDHDDDAVLEQPQQLLAVAYAPAVRALADFLQVGWESDELARETELRDGERVSGGGSAKA